VWIFTSSGTSAEGTRAGDRDLVGNTPDLLAGRDAAGATGAGATWRGGATGADGGGGLLINGSAGGIVPTVPNLFSEVSVVIGGANVNDTD
jgi:hypothetical protein